MRYWLKWAAFALAVVTLALTIVNASWLASPDRQNRASSPQAGNVSARRTGGQSSTRTRALGTSPKTSGAYRASTRVGGSAKWPALFRRSVYSMRKRPFGNQA